MPQSSTHRIRPPPGARRAGLAALCAAAGFALGGCAGLEGIAWPWQGFRPGSEKRAGQARASELEHAEVYRSAQAERVAYLEREIERLRADLRQAEESLVAIESGLRGVHTRADAVSLLAEARIEVDRAGRNIVWRPERMREAHAKLDEAERQLQAGHAGSAVFFASRAQRIAQNLNDEALKLTLDDSARFVKTERANLRAGPSIEHDVVGTLEQATPVFAERERGGWVLVRTLGGPVGWIHTSLLRPR
jgi:hypothetical protein